MTALLQNRPPMSDEQRKAMFARLRGAGGYHSGGSASHATPEPPAEGGPATTPTLGSSGGPDFQDLADTLASSQAIASLFDGSGATDIDPAFLSLAPPDPENYGTLPPMSSGQAALQTALLFTGGLGRIPAVVKGLASMGTAGKAIASWKTPLAAGGTAWGIAEYRDDHPTMDPRLEKTLAIAQQIAAYVSAISGLGAGKTAVAKIAPKKIAGASAWLKDLGEAIELSGKSLAEILPDKVRAALAKAHGGYTKVADVTGASWSDVMNAPRMKRFLDQAKALREAAADARRQADDIVSAASDKRLQMKDEAGRILKASHKGSLADWASAQRMYDEGAAKWYAAEYGQASSVRTARLLREQAATMEEQAAQVTRDAYASAVKAGLVAAGFTAKELHEEAKIRAYQAQMEAAWAQGDDFAIPAEQPRGTLGTLGAAMVGTLGNPIEKQTRYGQDYYAASVANYRAKYDAIGKAEKSGELTTDEAQKMREKLAEHEKPWNMAGKGPWTFAPASAAFLSWQAAELGDYFDHQVEVGNVAKVLDGDTIELAGGQIVRLLGMDTPESVHPDKPPEYLGPEASQFQKKNLTGKTVRLVQSPGVDTDKYGRTLRYVETLPGPLDALHRLPGVGKWIPGVDQNERMIELGYGQPRYLELSGGHERQKEYDKAVARARQAGAGVWSPEGLEALDYHYRTYYERTGRTPPAEGSQLGSLLGSGLMLTGQSGALSQMGGAGNAIAQAWNAALAGIGAAEFNAKAGARTNAIVFRPPKAAQTDYEKRLDDFRRSRRTQSL